jgi:signal peptidase II
MSLLKKSVLLVALILLVDQAIKIYIKTHFALEQSVPLLGNSAFLHFTENKGMAFGIELGGDIGKLLLTVFRVVFIAAIGWMVLKLIRRSVGTGLVLGLAAMFAGALGNLIDCLFYGMVFSDSTYTQVAQLFPAGGGYAPLGFGKVVDMFYLPVIRTTYPEWFPFNAGEPFVFFRPIFNLADAAITVSVFYLLIFQRTLFRELDKKDNNSLTP